MRAKLLVVHGRPQGQALLFPAGEYVFGRGAECHIRPNSDWVSRQHCLLRVTRDALFIRDLGSRNGTLVNGERLVGERALAQGDMLQVGPLVFQVDMDEAAPSSALPPTVEETGTLCAETSEVQLGAGPDSRAPSPEPTTATDLPVAMPRRS